MSFSRPDPSSPASIAEASFGTSRRGFDQAEVKDFLRMVAAEFGRLREREVFLERELQAAQADPDSLSARFDDETMTRMLGEEAMRVLLTARESANEIREKAEAAAAQLLNEAGDEASRVREEADIEASRRRADAAADAESELAMAKQQGREMVNEARAYRERVLSELARRRELAREQIEQLIHGRDRLMQAFERARLVAVDVVAEMQPLGEPDEYVNLTPTTGPLPVMIANSRRPDDSMAVDDGAAPTVGGDETAAIPVTTDEPETVEDAADAADSDDAEVPDAAADAEDDPDVAEDAEQTAEADADEKTADETTDGADAEAVDDDVVVDLFARLRAGTDDAEETDAPVVTAAEENAAAVEQSDEESGGDEVDAEQTLFELRDEELTPLIVASAKKLKRVLADEQNEVLDALRRGEAVHQLDELLPSIGEHAARYNEAITEELQAAVHAGSATSRPTNRKIRKALVTESVAAATDAMEQWLVTPLRDRLERSISDGGGENAAVTKKVRSIYREWKTQHIDETLDDIVRTAHGRGVLAGFNPDTPIVWELDERVPACPDCEDNALAGAVGAGDQFPTGDNFAPAHQGCRCLLAAADG